MKYTVLFITFIMLAVSSLEAQKVIIDDDIYATTAVKRFSKTAGGTLSGVVYRTADSLSSIPVTKEFVIGTERVTLSPDSIVWYWWSKGATTADSVSFYLTVVPKIPLGDNATRFPVDSSLANENDYKSLSVGWWIGAKELKAVINTINLAGVANKNQYKANGGSYFVLKQRRYFTLPG